MQKNILVPTDFSRVSETSLNHALKVAKTIKAEINLLHVISRASEKEDSEMKLAIIKKGALEKYPDAIINTIVVEGSIFEDIGEIAEKHKSELIIMGTHGRKGLQFITGSRAVRVVSSSPTPFVVVQNRAIKPEGYDDIVVPLDLHQETKQKLHIVTEIAKYFESRVHLIIPHETDEFLANKLKRNLKFAKQYLEEHDISYTATVSEEDSGDFDDGIIHHAAALEADLIAIMNLKENSLMGILGNNYVEHILTNEAQVPVMIINPISTSFVSSVLSI
ncbi:MAG: nucleotide-binding universal stress UspA family protein [Patiriisocius sp.]|jgi:nucleotide-binding universal stress UspA family protein